MWPLRGGGGLGVGVGWEKLTEVFGEYLSFKPSNWDFLDIPKLSH